MTILAGPLCDEVKRLWRVFEVEYQSIGVQIFAHPNLTFGGGRCRDSQALAERLEDLAGEIQPFELSVTGIDEFSEPDRVVFLRVALTEQLAMVHRAVDRVLEQHCVELLEHYRPEAWVPHITIGMGDLSYGNFERARADLSSYDQEFKHCAGEISLVQSASTGSGFDVVHRWRLRNQGAPSGNS